MLEGIQIQHPILTVYRRPIPVPRHEMHRVALVHEEKLLERPPREALNVIQAIPNAARNRLRRRERLILANLLQENRDEHLPGVVRVAEVTSDLQHIRAMLMPSLSVATIYSMVMVLV